MRRHLPNAVTIVRVALLPLLLWLAVAGNRHAFGALLLCCLAGDVLDGMLARALRAMSPLGSLLDSIADALLFVTAVAGVLLLYPDEVAAHRVAFWCTPAAWLSENMAALVRYGRLSSFHTYLSRAAAVAMGAFGAVLIVRGFEPILLRTAAAAVALATIEEFVLLYLLPEWTSDVRGVAWVLRSRAMADAAARQA